MTWKKISLTVFVLTLFLPRFHANTILSWQNKTVSNADPRLDSNSSDNDYVHERHRRTSNEGLSGPCVPGKIQTHVSHPGNAVQLICDQCKRNPIEERLLRKASWDITLVGGRTPSLDELAGDDVVRHETQTTDIMMHNIRANLAGTYKCNFGGQLRAWHQLTVKMQSHFQHVTEDPQIQVGDDPSIRWRGWTSCMAPKCDSEGEQMRAGYCFTRKRANDNNYRDPYVPCGSEGAANRELTRPDLKYIAPCTKTCDPSRAMDQPEGRQKAPTEDVSGTEGSNVELECTDLHHRTIKLVRWEKDGVVLKQRDMHTGGGESSHYTVDDYQALIIHGATQADEGDYICWLNFDQKARYRLNVLAEGEKASRGSGDSGGSSAGKVVVVLLLLALAAGGGGFAYYKKRGKGKAPAKK